jgi:Class II flagellar assembly regulator
MRIQQSSPLSPTVARRAAQAPSGDGRFAEALSGETATNSANAPQTVATVDNLFVLQEISDEVTNRRRALQRGNNLLDRLDDIRIALLTGSLPRNRLEELRHMAREQVDLAGDPKLAAILDEIELRVAVELAKLDKVA